MLTHSFKVSNPRRRARGTSLGLVSGENADLADMIETIAILTLFTDQLPLLLLERKQSACSARAT